MHKVRPPWKIAVALVLAIALVGGILLLWPQDEADPPAQVRDETARQQLEQRLGVTVKGVMREQNGSSDIFVEDRGGSIELYGVPDEKAITSLAIVPDRSGLLSSDVAVVTGTPVERAVIRLPKQGPVLGIVRCDDFNAYTAECGQWVGTDIQFTDHIGYVEFEVPHFTGYGVIPKTQKLFVTSAADTPTPNLATTQDGTLNGNAQELASGALYQLMNASAQSTEARVIRTTDTILFSSYWSNGNRVDAAYATFKLYTGTGGATLVCQSGNDGTGGALLPDGVTGLRTGSCSPGANITVLPGDSFYYVVNVWAQTIGGGGAAAKTATLQWDTTTADTWVNISSVQLLDVNLSVNTTTVYPDHAINASGAFFYFNGSTIAGASYNVSFYNTSNALVHNQTGTTTSTGFYNSTYTTPSGTAPGTWKVNVSTRINSTHYAINETTFSVGYYVNAESPANGTAIDRDGTDIFTPDAVQLAASTSGIPAAGTTISFYANITSPSIGGQTDILLGTNTTNSSGNAVLWFNPGTTMYSGSYVWWANGTSGKADSLKTFIVKGTLDVRLSEASNHPPASVFHNQSFNIRANVSSPGPETRDELASQYLASADVTGFLKNTTGNAISTTMFYDSLNDYWYAITSPTSLGGVGAWAVNATVGATLPPPYFYSGGEQRLLTVYGYSNISSNTTVPSSVPENGFATITCRAVDQDTAYLLSGLTVEFYRNSTLLGSNTTNSSGDASFTFQTATGGVYDISCATVDEPLNYYYRSSTAYYGNTTLTVVDGTPPTISAVQNTSAMTSFTVNWTTDEAANSSILYGTTTDLLDGSNSSSSYVTSHSRKIYGLQTETQYWYNITSCDASGNCNTTGPYEVYTAPFSCGTVSESGTYTLTGNITSEGDCFLVNSAIVVTIDGNGKTLTGNGSGVAVSATNGNVTIRNFASISNFSKGVYAGSGIDRVIVSNNSINVSTIGVETAEVKNVSVHNNMIIVSGDNSKGGYNYCLGGSCKNIVFENNTVSATGAAVQGLQVWWLGSFTVTNNTITASGTGSKAIISPSGEGHVYGNKFTASVTAEIGGLYSVLAGNVHSVNSDNGTGIVLTASYANIINSSISSTALNGTAISVQGEYNNISNSTIHDVTTGILVNNNNTVIYNVSLANLTGADIVLETGATAGISIENTMFGNYSILSPTKVSVKNAFGALDFLQGISGSGINMSQDLQLYDNYAYVNSSQAGLNKPANITFYSLPWQFEPVIERDGEACSTLICEVLSYSSGTLLFNVTGFSNYTSKANTQLNITDQTDTTTRYVNDLITFYANYTRKNNGAPISGAGIFCNFTENSSGSWSTVVNMTYNSTSTLYEYNKSFSTAGDHTFRVTCDGSVSGWEVLTLTDSFTVTALSGAPTFNGDVNDSSNSTSPTTSGANVTFTASATDPESDQWKLVICDGTSVTAGACDGSTFCTSALVNSGSTASCQFNTSSSLLENYAWYAFACDSSNSCSGYNDTNSPFHVNHYPIADTAGVTPVNPNITTTLGCTVTTIDPDMDTISVAYRWFIRNEGSGSYSLISGQTGNTLPAGNFDSNDQVICEATPTDEHGLTGSALNSSDRTISPGVLSASSNLADLQLDRGQTTTLNGTCTVSDGETAALTLTIEDNHTGTYTQSDTSAGGPVYVSQSSFSLGAVSSTSVLRQATIYTATAGNYSFRVSCAASDTSPVNANSVAQTLEVVADTTAPVLSNVRTSSLTTTSARILWDSDDSSDSLVEYGNTTALGSSVFDPSLVTSHSVLLISLSPDTLYHYNVTSCNTDGYCTAAGPFTFTTKPVIDPAPSQKGYCTARIVEQGPDYREGYISKGDVVEFYCEAPNEVRKREEIEITLLNKNRQLRKELVSPSIVAGDSVVVYP